MAEVQSRHGMTAFNIVAGTHLSKEHSETWREIAADGFSIDHKIEMPADLLESDREAEFASTVLLGVSEALRRFRPDLIVLLGDRYELLSAAQAAVLAGVPIAHIHGGETTEGAIDESIRHAITKLSYLHFAAAKNYAARIQQMGESPDRIWTVGALAMDNIKRLKNLPLQYIETLVGIPIQSPSFLLTYHPETLEADRGESTLKILLEELEKYMGSIVITGVNVDPGAHNIREIFKNFAKRSVCRVGLVESLGVEGYLNAIKHVDVVVGNSSSGIIEAPAIGTPTIDVGLRQKGRLRAPSVIHCSRTAESISHALELALSPAHRKVTACLKTPYGSPGVAKRIVDILQTVEVVDLRKPFYSNDTHLMR